MTTAMVLDMMEQLRDQAFDQALATLQKRLDIQESIRNVNDRYIDSIAAALPGTPGNVFRTDALRQGYSSIFRPTRGERAMLSAMEIEDLDPDTLLAVADLMQQHSDEISSINADILIILRSEEINRELKRAEERMARYQGDRDRRDRRDRGEEPEYDPVREAYDNREETDERYLATLRTLLGQEQYDAVAGRRGRGRRDDSGGGRNGGFSREDFMADFDKNGDGEIDETEREAAREAMRERFRQRRGGQGGENRGGQPREL